MFRSKILAEPVSDTLPDEMLKNPLIGFIKSTRGTNAIVLQSSRVSIKTTPDPFKILIEEGDGPFTLHTAT